MGNTYVSVMLQNPLTYLLWMHGAVAVVNVRSIGLVAVHNDICPQFAQSTGRGLVGCSVTAVGDNGHSF